MWDPVAGVYIEHATNISLDDVFVSFVGTPRSEIPISCISFFKVTILMMVSPMGSGHKIGLESAYR